MPRRYKPSTWQPKGAVADWERLKWYTPQALDNIVEGAAVSDPAILELLKRAVLKIVDRYAADKHLADRPSAPEIRTALDEISEQLNRINTAFNEVGAALEALDSDTRDLLLISAGFDPLSMKLDPWSWSAPDAIDLKKGQIESAASEAAKNRKLVDRARQFVGAGRRGRPKMTAEYEAVRRLAIAWDVAKGAKPTRQYDWLDRNEEYGEFKKFAQAALDPLGVQVSDEMAKWAISEMKK